MCPPADGLCLGVVTFVEEMAADFSFVLVIRSSKALSLSPQKQLQKYFSDNISYIYKLKINKMLYFFKEGIIRIYNKMECFLFGHTCLQK
jgi:hypothetical protein